jgi:hypothetical protein
MNIDNGYPPLELRLLSLKAYTARKILRTRIVSTVIVGLIFIAELVFLIGFAPPPTSHAIQAVQLVAVALLSALSLSTWNQLRASLALHRACQQELADYTEEGS